MRRTERKYSIEEASDIFNGRLPADLTTHRLSERMRLLLAKAASKLPGNIVDYASVNVMFVSSSGQPAFNVSFKLRPFKGVVFLSECLLGKPEDEQAFIVAHEIAHFKLKHRLYGGLTRFENQRQEMEANETAEKWLGFNPYKKTFA
jgi:Zn-dependent protease with chaperone function